MWLKRPVEGSLNKVCMYVYMYSLRVFSYISYIGMHVPTPEWGYSIKKAIYILLNKVYRYACPHPFRTWIWDVQYPITTQPCLSNIATSSGLRSTGRVSQKELTSWEQLGEGGFSKVYKAKLKGNDVAVKVLKNLKETKSLLTEGNLLRYFYSWFSEVTQFLSYRRWKILFWFYDQAFVDFITWGRLT